MFGYGMSMTDDDRQMLRGIIAHCCEKLAEADRAGDKQAARTRAYGRVMRAARDLLEEMEGRGTAARAIKTA